MDTTAQATHGVFGIHSESISSSSKLSHDPEALRRSRENVSIWVQYLPDDCVKRMISMGWDLST